MPRYFLTTLAAVACFTCAIMAYIKFQPVLRPPDASFDGPGTYSFTAPVSGEFTLWHNFHSASAFGFTIQEPDLPAGTLITVTHKGNAIQTTVFAGNTLSTPRGKRKTVLRFVAPEPGEYLIETSGFPARRIFEITHGDFFKPLLLFFAWGAGSALSGLLAIVFLIIALVRQTRAPQTSVHTNPTPS